MIMNNIIDNGKVTGKIKNVYKFIEKHDSYIKTIFNDTYTDLKSIFSDVTMNDNTITVNISDSDTIDPIHSMVKDVINKHTENILGAENTHIIPYVFQTAIVNKSVLIMYK